MTKQVAQPLQKVRGPRPLALHIGTQTMSWIGSLAALTSLNSGSLSSRPGTKTRTKDLVDNLKGIDPEVFRQAVEEQSRLRLAEFAEGVLSYRHFERPPRIKEPPVIWSEGTTRLLDYGTSQKAPVVLFVPSLINRAYILDLAKNRSLMRHLARQGLRPLLVDWGSPGELEAGFTLENYIAERLTQALQVANDLNGGPVGLVGYCMGGTLTLGLAAIRPEKVKALGLMATPWDFHGMDPGKTRVLKAMLPAIESLLDYAQVLPVDVLQSMFASLHPTLNASKFRAFAALDKKSARARAFVALEDWLNDGVSLSGPTARECLGDWYVENTPGRGKWKIDGQTIEPERIDIPSLVIVPMTDHIVPPASALPLAEKLPDSKCLKLPAGHIGMVAGSRGKELLYSPLGDWLSNILT